MATLAKLLVEVGVKMDGALKVEQRVTKLRKGSKKFGDQAKKSFDGASRGMKTFGDKAKEAGAKMKGSLTGMLGKLGPVGSAIGGLVDSLGGALGKGGKGGLAGAALAAATAILAIGAAMAKTAVATFKFVNEQTATMDQLNKLSASVGVGVEDLQRLQFVAGQSGVTNESLSAGLKKLNQNLFDMSTGGGKGAADALALIGLSLRSLEGQTATKQIGIISDALKGVDDQARRSSIAAKIFGEESGPALASMLNAGSASIDKLAESTRGVFTQEDADNASAYQDKLGEIKQAFDAVATKIAVALLPVFDDLITAVTNLIGEYEEFLLQDIPGGIQEIVGATKQWSELTQELNGGLSGQIGILTGLEGSWALYVTTMKGQSYILEGITNSVRDMNAALSGSTKILGTVTRVGEGAGAGESAAYRAKTEENRRAHAAKMAARDAKQTAYWSGKGPQPWRLRPGETLPEYQKRRGEQFAREDKLEKEAERQAAKASRAAKAAAREAKAKAKRDKKKDPVSGVTVDEAYRALLSGQGDVLQEKLRGLSAATPSTRDIKPTVAIDFYSFMEGAFQIEQNFASPDPMAAGQESAAAIKRVFRQETAAAGQSLAGSTVR